MKNCFRFFTVFLCTLSLLVFSCGGGGGGGGGGAVSVSGASDVAINFNGLYADTGATSSVWETIDYLDLTIYADGLEVYSKHLTAGDNTVLVEKLKTGSQVRAVGSLKFNQANGGGTGNVESDTITLARGENTLRINVVYTYELRSLDGVVVASGTYTAASGISVPETEPGMFILTGWTDQNGRTYPPNLSGIRGNVVLNAEYTENRDYFHVYIDSETWNKHLYLHSATRRYSDEDDDHFALAFEDICMYDLSSPHEITVACTGDGLVNVTLGTDNGTIYAVLTAERAGDCTVRFSRGSYYTDLNVTVEDLLTIEGTTVTSFNLPQGATADDLVSYKLPSGISAINQHAADVSYSNIYFVDMGETSITETPVNLFGNSSKLREVILPDSLTAIGQMTFSGCVSLESISLPASLTSISVSAFEGCTGLGDGETFYLPDSLLTIGSRAFQDCSSLSAIGFNNVNEASLTSIGYEAFKGCELMELIELPATLESIGYDTFSGCDFLEDVYYGGANVLAWEALGPDWGGLTEISGLQLMISDNPMPFGWYGGSWLN